MIGPSEMFSSWLHITYPHRKLDKYLLYGLTFALCVSSSLRSFLLRLFSTFCRFMKTEKSNERILGFFDHYYWRSNDLRLLITQFVCSMIFVVIPHPLPSRYIWNLHCRPYTYLCYFERVSRLIDFQTATRLCLS